MLTEVRKNFTWKIWSRFSCKQHFSLASTFLRRRARFFFRRRVDWNAATPTSICCVDTEGQQWLLIAGRLRYIQRDYATIRKKMFVNKADLQSCGGSAWQKQNNFISPFPVGERISVVMRVSSICMFVCLFARISQEPLVQISPNFLCMLPTAMARLSPGSVTIRYVVLAVWMTSCVHVQ